MNDLKLYPIPCYEDLYAIDVANETIYNLKRRRQCKVAISTYGYKKVTLFKEGIPKNTLIHRIIAMLFVPNPYNLPEVNHIDGNKLNNKVSNLEWCTSQQNTAHAYKMGLINNKGAKNGRAKITKRIANSIRREIVPYRVTRKALANKYGISKSMIDMILQNKNWI